jgi:hypothetical protein
LGAIDFDKDTQRGSCQYIRNRQREIIQRHSRTSVLPHGCNIMNKIINWILATIILVRPNINISDFHDKKEPELANDSS